MITRPYSPSTTMKSSSDQHQDSIRPYSPYRYSTNGQIYYKNQFDLSQNKIYKDKDIDKNRNRSRNRDGSMDRWQNASRSLSPFARDYSPWRRENVDPPGVIQPVSSSLQQSQLNAQPTNVNDIYASPMINRKRFTSEQPVPSSHGSTSPQLLISRFAHQMKQELSPTAVQSQSGSKESAKKRFASYVRLRLGGDRAPSPEPPPRFSRGESPLALRKNISDQPSPSFSRRYISPSPPQPPPRRLSESSSVPGSPQHIRTRLHYTPEPQRRPPIP